jgi:hypothetical protein
MQEEERRIVERVEEVERVERWIVGLVALDALVVTVVWIARGSLDGILAGIMGAIVPTVSVWIVRRYGLGEVER